ncbi:MAG: chaperone modulator CbpM [Caldimonas sp.]|uniref:chaperone modulator CbpM n=1 Tax=Caldimonas sp. TaxID=2838790 RepID=UPI00391D56D6
MSPDILPVAPPDEALLDLEALCRCAPVSREWVLERVRCGLIALAGGDGASAWRFDAATLRRVRCMVHLERHFDAVPELAALVADLHDEIDALRRRLARAGL